MSVKNKIIGLVLTICLILSCTIYFSACKDTITDVAYIQFIPAVEGEVVQYTSYMYADDGSKAHIYLFSNEEAKANGTAVC